MDRIEHGTVVGDHRPRDAARLAVPPGVSQLDHHHQFVSERFAGRLPGLVHQPGEGIDVPLVQAGLPWIASGVVQHRRSLEPDQSGAPSGVTPVAAEAQLAG